MELNRIDINSLRHDIFAEVPEHFINNPGVEPYALYAYYSNKLPKGSTISDLGTLQGLSALALSSNKGVKVESYDIDQSKNIVEKYNIEFILGNCFDHIESILKSDLILVDIDPHDGIQEMDFYDILKENNYKGLTLWDDIHHNLGMNNFWHKAELAKIDLTQYGHHSGTGVIEFK